MGLSLVTAPAAEPVSLAEAKAQCSIDASILDDDALLNGLIRGAREFVETYTGRALLTQTWDWKLDGFPCGAMVIPLAPVASVTSITYTDMNGAGQTWSSALYETDLPTGPQVQRARIQPVYLQIYPVTRVVFNAVVVRFVAGYGATGASVPYGILAAMKLLIAHWYTRREPVNVGSLVTPIPFTVDSLLWPYKAC